MKSWSLATGCRLFYFGHILKENRFLKSTGGTLHLVEMTDVQEYSKNRETKQSLTCHRETAFIQN